jgi:hypothetical protein
MEIEAPVRGVTMEIERHAHERELHHQKRD